MAGEPLQVGDASVLDSLARAFGHAPPFTAAECESFDGTLAVADARDLSVLSHFRSLKSLEVFRSDLKVLTAVASMRDLESLKIIACPVADLAPLRGLPRLEDLEVSFTFVEDAAPIFTLPALHCLRLLGNPLSEASYDQVRSDAGGADLDDEPTPPSSGQLPPAIQVSGPAEWQAGRKLHERGIALCFARVDHWAPLLVKPGADSAAFWSTFGELDALLENAAATTETILALPWSPAEVAGPSSVVSAREIGDATDALGWIDQSDLPADEADALRRFVSGFPGLVYYRDGEPYLADKERTGKVELPVWYRKTRMTLGFVAPGEAVTSILGEDGDVELKIEPLGYNSSSGKRIRAAAFYPMAVASDHSATFAISLDGRDHRVYELREEWYLSDDYEPKSRPWVAYPSYAAMLAEIVTIVRANSTEIERST